MYNSALTVQGVAVNKSIVASIVRGDAEGLRSIALRLRGDAEGLWAIAMIWHQFDSISCKIW